MFELAALLFLGPDPMLGLGAANPLEARRWCVLLAAAAAPAAPAVNTAVDSPFDHELQDNACTYTATRN
jgi:hypothetical protein